MPADEDIMNQLRKIDEAEILSEEINLDDDLDFDGLDDMDNEPSPVATIAPPVPRTETSGGEVESSGGEVESSGGEADADSGVPATKPAAKKASKSKSRPKTTKPAQEPPTQADTSVTEVGEVIVRAKTLRIVAEKVIIEPGNISFSP